MSRRAATNPWIGVNFIPNFRMATPPAYWLQRLYDFDADLVVFPSKNQPFAYVLARRARLTGGMTDQAILDTVTQPDTLFCFKNRLVPVSMIYRHGTGWSIDNIIRSLKARDIWAQGGAEKVAEKMDEQDEAGRTAIKKDIRDDMWNRSGDAWRSYQARTGQRSKLTVPKVGTIVPNPRTERRIQTAPSGSTAGSGIVLATA